MPLEKGRAERNARKALRNCLRPLRKTRPGAIPAESRALGALPRMPRGKQVTGAKRVAVCRPERGRDWNAGIPAGMSAEHENSAQPNAFRTQKTRPCRQGAGFPYELRNSPLHIK